ncbi:alpha/beta fold hydrolase [Streptomyces sp. NPDC014734]|uniref:alpha/beta fold hydrolase n=1 Tax=Streptomyces sp. NPDC014734 TaxID=3364886 RepID=UPI0036F55923
MPSSPLPAPRTRIAGRRARTVAAAVTAAALAAAAAPAAADTDADADPAVTRPTVVLVHGAFADASGWKAVAERLRGDGYEVMTPDNPLRGLAADSAHLAAVLKGVKGPIVLAGHSYGGAVISNAAAANPRVKALAFVSAFMPDKGESLSDLGTRFTGAELNAALKPMPVKNADGTEGTDLYIRPERFREVFAADLPAGADAPTAAAQRPLGGAAFMDRATAAAWRTIPSWALVATRDKAIAPDLERFEAKRAKSHTVEIDSSHAVPAAHPDAVADLVRQAAGGGTSDTSSMASTGISTLILAGLGGLAVLTVLTGAGILAAAQRRRITGSGTGRLL